jgi:NTP pyrophosphatase (non-canonical NTP hydrolase)
VAAGLAKERRSMEQLIEDLRQFVHERDWEQFHTPKNLAMALSVEVAEIVEQFQWLTPEESQALSSERRVRIQDEIGDVLIYLAALADRLGIDPVDAARRKLVKNRSKYPVKKVKGKALKYSEYESG